MKLVIGLVVGFVVGGCLGINYGKEAPLLSNPFDSGGITDTIEEKGAEVLEMGEEAVEKGMELLPGK